MNLQDCRQHGPDIDNELILVEGLSAAANVRRGRDANTQAVLAMQGKPVNAAKASPTRVEQNRELQALTETLGCGARSNFDVLALRYQRVLLLFDPDADGIHCGALVQIFLQQYMPKLIEGGKVLMLRAPLFEITVPGQKDPVHAYSEPHHQKLCQHFEQQGISGYKSQRFKGVASLSVPLLKHTCLQPETRIQQPLSPDDARMARRVFGGR